MNSEMNRLLAKLNQNAPAIAATIQDVEQQLGMKLPPEYTEFLKKANGGEGFIGHSAYVILWPAGEIASMNRAYEVQKCAPGLLVFGSDGGREAFGFDTRHQPWQVVQVPFVGMAWDVAHSVGETFREFLERLYRIE